MRHQRRWMAGAATNLLPLLQHVFFVRKRIWPSKTCWACSALIIQPNVGIRRYVVKCRVLLLMPHVCQATAVRAPVQIQDASLSLPRRCLLVDHETQSGRWWSACQCHRLDRDVSLPLYKSLHPCCCGVNLGLFLTSGWTSWQKAICQRLICIQAISSMMWWRLTTPSAYFPGACRALYRWGWREGRSACFHVTARLLVGNSSLTRQTEFPANCCFTGAVIHKQDCEYSWLHCSVIDPLCLLLMLDVTPSRPVSHWQHLLPASIIYYFLSACTWKKWMFKEAPYRWWCLSDRMIPEPFVPAVWWYYLIIKQCPVMQATTWD